MKSRSATKSGPGRMHSRPKERRKDKQFAAAAAISEPLRRYADRYGVDPFTVMQTRKKADALIASRAEHRREVAYDNDEVSDGYSNRHYPQPEQAAA